MEAGKPTTERQQLACLDSYYVLRKQFTPLLSEREVEWLEIFDREELQLQEPRQWLDRLQRFIATGE